MFQEQVNYEKRIRGKVTYSFTARQFFLLAPLFKAGLSFQVIVRKE